MVNEIISETIKLENLLENTLSPRFVVKKVLLFTPKSELKIDISKVFFSLLISYKYC